MGRLSSSRSTLFRAVDSRRLLSLVLFLALTACHRRAAPDTLVIAEESAAVDFDPRFALDAYSSRVVGLLYAGLVSQDAHAELQPDLATSWYAAGGTTYVFTLRPGLTFHDGRALTAADVVYTYTSLRDPALRSPKADEFKELLAVTAPNDTTVVFTLRRPFAPFLQSLKTGIVPRGAGRELARRPVGAGPFRLVDFDPGARIILGAFADYHGGAPRIKRVVIKTVPNDTTRLLELRKGSVQLLVNSIPPDGLAQLRADPRLQILTQPGLNVSYLGFNLRDPRLADVRVRRAFAHAIDREGLIRNLLAGGAVTTATILAPMLWSSARDLPTYAYDPARARALLDASGYRDPDGPGPQPRFTLTYKTSTNPLRRRIADAIAAELRDVGIALEVQGFEFATFFDDIKKGNFAVFSLVWVGIVEPDALYNIFHSTSLPPAGANRGAFADAEADRLLEQGRATLDRAERTRIYAALQRRLAAELPYVTLWVQNDVAAASTRLRGFTLYPGGDYTGIVRATMSDEATLRRAQGERGR
jgi:peptide/nickel transport system substrate-binding protein